VRQDFTRILNSAEPLIRVGGDLYTCACSFHVRLTSGRPAMSKLSTGGALSALPALIEFHEYKTCGGSK